MLTVHVFVLYSILVFSSFVNCLLVSFFLSFGATAPSELGHPHSRGFYIAYNGATQSVGLLWTSDQLVTETST